MANNKLTDTKIRTAKTTKAQEWLGDGGGLYLSLKSSGNKSWVYRYSRAGKENWIGLGGYPEISLLDARIKRDEIKKVIAAGGDVSKINEPETPAAPTSFKQVADDYLANAKKRKSEQRIAKIKQALDKHVIPLWGDREINTIKARDVISLLQHVEQSGSYTVTCVHSYITWIFEFALTIELIEGVPVTKASLTHVAPHKTIHMRSMDFERLPAFLEDLSDYGGLKITKLAIKFLLLTAIRTMDLRRLKWSWIDLDKAIVTIPAEEHKTGLKAANKGEQGESFYILLSKQAERILQRAHEITGDAELVFPSPYDHKKQASDAIVNKSLERMGWIQEHSGHGFRALFRTAMEREGYDEKYLELCLNHTLNRDKTERAYARGMNEAFHPERLKIMQDWADLIDLNQR